MISCQGIGYWGGGHTTLTGFGTLPALGVNKRSILKYRRD